MSEEWDSLFLLFKPGLAFCLDVTPSWKGAGGSAELKLDLWVSNVAERSSKMRMTCIPSSVALNQNVI